MPSKALLTLLAAALLLLPAPGSAQDGASILDRAGQARVKGAADAPVQVLEIADFQCPFCGRFAAEVFPRLDSAYVATGKVKWVFVNLPLANHRNAWHAAEAALCAGGVADRFWEVHDRLFETQADWSNLADPRGYMAEVARAATVPAAAYDACVAGDQVAALLVQDIMYAATRPGMSGTPAFLINEEKMLVGLKSFEEWQAVLEAELQKSR